MRTSAVSKTLLRAIERVQTGEAWKVRLQGDEATVREQIRRRIIGVILEWHFLKEKSCEIGGFGYELWHGVGGADAFSAVIDGMLACHSEPRRELIALG